MPYIQRISSLLLCASLVTLLPIGGLAHYGAWRHSPPLNGAENVRAVAVLTSFQPQNGQNSHASGVVWLSQVNLEENIMQTVLDLI